MQKLQGKAAKDAFWKIFILYKSEKNNKISNFIYVFYHMIFLLVNDFKLFFFILSKIGDINYSSGKVH